MSEESPMPGPLIDAAALRRFAAGDWRAVAALAPVLTQVGGVRGLRCAVWAPNARRVSLVGDFNAWDPQRHPMRLRPEAGVWECFLPEARAGDRYKFAVLGADGILRWKADPLARRTECPPHTASVVDDAPAMDWTDGAWCAARAARQHPGAPISIYEVHAGSWARPEGEGELWERLGERLPAYARALGFTHIELLPVMEHPFGGSWGYQPLGLFAPTARHGTPRGFARFIDRCHAAEVGVILDWVPSHFPEDPHGLEHFDGTALYEHADPREGHHPDWHSAICNLGRNEVKAMLLASAHHWLAQYHLDGLRVDAVASMLYRDYSRAPGQWIPNRHGGRENLESIDFLRELTDGVRARGDGAITIAEESTAWPGVTAPTRQGGLGFDYKWNMGWMHDTLQYMRRDPVHRRHHHGEITFGLQYAFSERFILPLSHDEVVHGKGALAAKMGGDPARRLDALRAYLAFMWAHPGKKLLFMGAEIGQWEEWNHDATVHWDLLDDPAHRAVQQWVGRLNRLYRDRPALHAGDADASGFSWTVGDDVDNSVFAFERSAPGDAPLLAVCNFTPVPRPGYELGASRGGPWRLLLDSSDPDGAADARRDVAARAEPRHGRPCTLTLDLPGACTLVLAPLEPQ
ncbi:1,4-alpha-glucan branching protein GlgB [Castellaniella defragrans]|uniref:1,4-alpha-glucan branching enzyme GlgB n=1 Tax=Castellaniella defragrans TaxID=75697 RepID=A0A7W9TKW0_CASDE|nr:1,4-alpha-glucan branching protein GlgB [Castellaniella defragrans]MBB6082286.1 1,4-alpha-glucan branching enzyme [Castellaniella defragrans]